MAQTLVWPTRDTDDDYEFSLNWKEAPDVTDDDPNPIPVLDIADSETITSVVHAIVSTPSDDASNPLVLGVEQTFDSDQQTMVWLSGGVAGNYVIECTIVTDGGIVGATPRTWNRKVKIKTKDL